MAKIRGKFAPLFEELGNDPRWLMECNDQQKFLFMLILFTIYTTNNSAPDDPHYYKVRYNLRHRCGRVEADLRHIKEHFPKLVCQNKKLSLLNYKGYENMVASKKSLEGEVEGEGEGEGKNDNHIPPFLEDVKTYFKEIEIPLQAEAFYDHFNSNGWRVGGKAQMRDWKAAARNWKRNIGKFDGNKKQRERKPFPVNGL